MYKTNQPVQGGGAFDTAAPLAVVPSTTAHSARVDSFDSKMVSPPPICTQFSPHTRPSSQHSAIKLRQDSGLLHHHQHAQAAQLHHQASSFLELGRSEKKL